MKAKEKGEVISDFPFFSQLIARPLERVPPVQKQVPPVTASAGYRIAPDVEVLLYSSRQILSIVPQQASADAHARRDEVPEIPLTQYHMVTMELACIDVGRASVTFHINPLEVCAK